MPEPHVPSAEAGTEPDQAGAGLPWFEGLRLLREEASNLVKTIPGPIAGVSLHAGGCSLEITWPLPQVSAQIVAPAAPSAALPPAGTPTPRDEGLRSVVAPLVGTFYAAPEPGRSPFVAVGDRIAAGATIGIVEAMKLMNPVVAECDGEVVEICVADSEPVEFDQVLVRIRTGER
jgi:acetyl-CoA carboxylase biotin carboxyl carrier protein